MELMRKVEKVWGHEVWIVNNEHYCGKELHLTRHYQCSLHCHKIKHETFYVWNGVVRLEVGDEIKLVYPGDVIEIPPNTYHRFTGVTDALIFEFSTPHSDDDVYRLEYSKEANNPSNS